MAVEGSGPGELFSETAATATRGKAVAARLAAVEAARLRPQAAGSPVAAVDIGGFGEDQRLGLPARAARRHTQRRWQLRHGHIQDLATPREDGRFHLGYKILQAQARGTVVGRYLG